MGVEFFEEERRQMVAAIRVITGHIGAAQQLVVAEKDLHGRFTMKEIMPVLFSKFEGVDEPAFRAS